MKSCGDLPSHQHMSVFPSLVKLRSCTVCLAKSWSLYTTPRHSADTWHDTSAQTDCQYIATERPLQACQAIAGTNASSPSICLVPTSLI